MVDIYGEMKSCLFCLFLACITNLQAHNNYFLPGDVFFSTSFSSKEIEKLEKNETGKIKVSYERLDNRFMACGNIGYYQLEFQEVDASFHENLLIAYEWIRIREEPVFVKSGAEGQEEFSEWNPVVALVYNRGKVAFPLGAKFNEDWEVEGGGQHGGFLDSGWSVVQEWQRAGEIAPLKLNEELDPAVHLKNGGEVHRTMDQLLTLNAADAEIVFVGIMKKNSWVHNECSNLKKLSEYSNWLEETSGRAFYLRVTSGGIRLVEYGTESEKTESVRNEAGEWVKVEETEAGN
jgi:hypothetical protein